MNRLRPCPFCGSDDVELSITALDDDYKFNKVNCNHCGVTVSFAVRECTRGYETRSADETVRMWNMGGDE